MLYNIWRWAVIVTLARAAHVSDLMTNHSHLHALYRRDPKWQDEAVMRYLTHPQP